MQHSLSNALEITIDGDLRGPGALLLSSRLPLGELASADHVVLSLTNVADVDAAGLAMLVRLYSHLRVRGTTLNLVDVQGPCEDLLRRVGLDRLLATAATAKPQARRHAVTMPVPAQA